MTYQTGTIERRFWAKADVPDSDVWEDECWPWTAARRPSGHGVIRVAGRNIAAHRMAYELAGSPLTDGEVVHHECENPACVNPAHLRALTRAGHLAHHRQVTHCKRGHELTPENTYHRGDGYRTCRICKVFNKKARRRMGME